MMRCKIYMAIVLLLITTVSGLEAKVAKEIIEIPFIDTPPQIDGKLDDPVWQKSVLFQGFISFKPDFGKPSREKTVAYACSDRENFYFAFRCFHKDVSHIKGTVTRRDNMFGDDWVSLNIDTFYNHQSAYGFLVNPLGIQGDGMMDANGDLDQSHDMVWYSKGIIDDKGYTVEIKIPFKSIRFPAKKKVKMGLWMVRNIVRTSEMVCFPEFSKDKGAALYQTQPILVKNIKYKRIVELLPALTHSRSRFHDEGQWTAETLQTDFSLTGKLGITPGLVLDAAYNPDFSQVEADVGQIDFNLRYALFYPEKRPFFLEGLEDFRYAGYVEGSPLSAVVHTRTILDPVFGLKVTGKLDGKNSISAIAALDEAHSFQDSPGAGRAGYGILRFRHALKKDAYIGGFYTGREVSEGYNRLAGIDGRLRLSRFVLAEYHLLGSITKDPGENHNSYGHVLGARCQYDSKNLIYEIGFQDISKDFRADTGFLTRQGITRLTLYGMYRFYPKSKFFQRVEPFYLGFHLLDKESNLVESMNYFTFRINMPRSSMFRINFILSNEVYAGRRFDTSGIGFHAYSQVTKHLFITLFYQRIGSIYYDPGNPFPGRSNDAYISLLYQPGEKFSTSLDLSYADFYRKSDSQKEYDYSILRSRTTYQLSRYLFSRGIVEYNFYREKLDLDFLVSFTYIPGTVVHVGYGSVRGKLRWNGMEYVPTDRFMEIQRAFFVKVSYLWRL